MKNLATSNIKGRWCSLSISPMLLTSLTLVILLMTSCGGGGSGTGSCNTFDCQTKKFNLVTADLDGSNLKVIVSSQWRELTHPRVTRDGQWLAFTRFNTKNANGCAEEVGSTYTNTEILAAKMVGGSLINLTNADPSKLSTNSYWIDNTYNFTWLEGPPGSIVIKRSMRDANMNATAADEIVPTPNTIHVFDPQQLAGKIVFGGLFFDAGVGIFVNGTFTMDTNGSNVVNRSLGVDRLGNKVDQSLAKENDPKLSPDGTKIAFMRRVDTANGHGWHIFVTAATATPGSEVDISWQYNGADLKLNDGVPEWIDNNTLIFFTVNIINNILERQLYMMKDNGSQRVKINLPAGYYYTHVFPYKDDTGKSKIIFAVNKISAVCT